MRRVKGLFDNDDYEYADRVLVREKGPDRVKEIRDMFSELLASFVRREMFDPVTGMCFYTEAPKPDVVVSFDYLKELCDTAEGYIEGGRGGRRYLVRCCTRSLCSASLWEKIKCLEKDEGDKLDKKISMREFSNKYGISMSTLNKMLKSIRKLLGN